jgi:hypothetical protein
MRHGEIFLISAFVIFMGAFVASADDSTFNYFKAHEFFFPTQFPTPLNTSKPAEASAGRRVEGGDLIFSATATSGSSDEAVFRARMAAVKNLAEECGVAPLGVKFGPATLASSDWKLWVAKSEAYISYGDCESSRDTKDKHLIEDPALAEDEALYAKMLAPDPPQSSELTKIQPEGMAPSPDPESPDQNTRVPTTIVVTTTDKNCWRELQEIGAIEEGITIGGPSLNVARSKLAECRAMLNHKDKNALKK